MEEGLILKVMSIGVLGVGAQWLAWRMRLPAIVLLSAAGLIAGPLTGLLQPERDFGPLLAPMVSVCVAIILFEGGLNLNLRELRETSMAVRRLVLVAVPLGWGMTTAAAHWAAGLAWPVAALFGGILVVTGPTVILPMLRQAKLTSRCASVLKWEGIVNDPIGALLAVLVFEALSVPNFETPLPDLAWLLAAAVFAAGLGFVLGRALVILFTRALVPEHLKASLLLVVVLLGFAAANHLQGETGLLTVTALGMTLANSRFASYEDMRRFKENLSVILISTVFILLTASLQPAILAGMLEWRTLAFVALLLFVIRPASVWLSTFGCGLSGRERALVAWIAPRGIVAVAVSGFFAGRLQQEGYADAAALVPLTFAVVFATVVAHGFTIRPLARRLELVSTARPGVLIVGSSRWSVALAEMLIELELPALIVDGSWNRLRAARQAGVPLHFGEVLSEAATHHMELSCYEWLLAVGDNDAYNAFVCTHMATHFGREHTFQLGIHEDDEHEHHGFAPSTRGRTLLHSGLGYDDLEERVAAGWSFQKTKLTEVYGWEQYQAERSSEAETLFIVQSNGKLMFDTQPQQTIARPGDVVVRFAPRAVPAGERPAAVAAA